MTDCNFQAWPKTPRLEKNIVLTEKIDGTNAQIHIDRVPEVDGRFAHDVIASFYRVETDDCLIIRAGSRNRYITPSNDNHGFAAWVRDNAADLQRLGPGRHYGEWWGKGIQRGYGKQEKHFSLFNVGRWYATDVHPRVLDPEGGFFDKACRVPECVEVAPILYFGPFSEKAIDVCKIDLSLRGSKLVDDYEKFSVPAEGIVLYHTGSNECYKIFMPGEG